ncbi:protein ImuA [Roseibium hamelinense]|uniref:Protein ImuA n=1 Tax=Roseibium hamelinense TaxID=150831 RepID=A0A562SL49_9HYPH|nr:inducible mutagenesis protein A [Roseibium hamelinense]MTI43258.1 inducible mutagenesis protein A [Roseibium hamelinense]TWI81813.1 protein ImuA [Roseibium hamelinense]
MDRSDNGRDEETCKPDRITELRRRIAGLEGRLPLDTQLGPAPASAASWQGPGNSQGGTSSFTPVPGLEQLDPLFRTSAFLEGGLHEVVTPQSRDAGALSGVAISVIASLLKARDGLVLWVMDQGVLREAGMPYPPGLLRFGMDPARVVCVTARRTEDLLWAMEEGAQCSALAAVVGEVRGASKALDLTATRRLMLRARIGGTPVFLLRHGTEFEPTAAMTRWKAAPHASAPPLLSGQRPHDGLGRAAWTVNLTRNRDGREGHLIVEWSHAARKLAAPAYSLPMVSGTGLRPGPEVLASGRTASGKTS